MGEEQNSESGVLPIISLILGIVGMLTTCIIIGILFCIAGLITGIISLLCKMPKKGLAISGIVTSVIGIIIFIIIFASIFSDTDTAVLTTVEQNETVLDASEDLPLENETTTLEETTVVVETTSEIETTEEETESAEEFKASCQEIGYKTLLRTPEEYIGQRIVITAEVQQIMKGGWFDDGKYYRLQTDNDGYEMYMDDEYFMYDFRSDDDMKILEGDVLKVYAEFAGVEEIKRALTKTNDEIPAIKAHYIELISE